MFRRTVLLVTILLALLAWPGRALAQTTSATGYDVSYPQCGASLPPSPSFGIVGVNDGIAYRANPCLSTEYQWALTSTATGRKASFYLNTANPGPASSHWPVGQASPQACTSATLNSACSYDYGWDTAADSFADAVKVAGRHAARGAPWWLDVESANSWSADGSDNVADIQGALDYLKQSAGAAIFTPAGIYTDSSSWSTITGGTRQFASYPSWVPGATTRSQAQANCQTTITGGKATYAQYTASGFDADYPCG